jgi:hypothetical protein
LEEPQPSLGAISAAKVRRALEDYRRLNAYPPWSRPASAGDEHLTNWNETFTVERRLDERRGIGATLSLSKHFAGPGKSLTATVTVHRERMEASEADGRGSSADAPVDFEVRGYVQALSGKSTAPDDSGFRNIAPLEFARGSEPDTLRASFVASEIEPLALEPSEARVLAVVNLNGQKYPLAVNFQYSAAAPLSILQKTGDRVVDGSLEIELLADVKVSGSVQLVGTLFDSSGPVAIYNFRVGSLRTGVQPVALTFFGRAIRESASNGPYYLGAVHGYVAPENNPFQWLVWEDNHIFATGAYDREVFSSDEWTSPEKNAQIRRYEALLQNLEQAKR